MSGDEPRSLRFVRTARRLLLFQVAASALAVGLAGWAMIEVADLVDERDRLAARVAELEAQPQADPLYPAELPPPPPDITDLPVAPATPAAPPPPATAPSSQPPSPPPPPPSPSPPPAPPAPTPPLQVRDCTRVDGRAVVCVPPYRRTPVTGVCLDGRNRLIRCPPNVRIEPAQEQQRQEPRIR